MDAIRRAIVFVNPSSGSGDEATLRQLLTSALLLNGWDFQFIVLEHGVSRIQLAATLGEEAAKGGTLVIACGGDGTASLVAASIIESGFAHQFRLGIFPSGTANTLARELGIPAEWPLAAEMLCTMETPTPLDAMKMGDRYFFLRIGIGVDAETIRATTRDAKRRLGRWAYFRSFLGQLFRPHRVQFRCVVDGKRHRFWAVQVFIANGGNIALVPFRIGPGIAFHDGVVNLCAYDALSWWGYLTLGWKLWLRNYHEHPLMKFYTVKKRVEVHAKPEVPVQGDGEDRTQTPVTITVLPAAVQVLAPAVRK